MSRTHVAQLDAWARLVGDLTRPVVSFELGKQHLPYFMASGEFKLANAAFFVSLDIATKDKPLPSITLNGTDLAWSLTEPKATVSNTDVLKIHEMQITNAGGFSPTRIVRIQTLQWTSPSSRIFMYM